MILRERYPFPQKSDCLQKWELSRKKKQKAFLNLQHGIYIPRVKKLKFLVRYRLPHCLHPSLQEMAQRTVVQVSGCVFPKMHLFMTSDQSFRVGDNSCASATRGSYINSREIA